MQHQSQYQQSIMSILHNVIKIQQVMDECEASSNKITSKCRFVRFSESLTNPVNINTTQSLQLQMFNWTQLQKWSITLIFQFIGLQHTSAV
jgi:hypothetical protein